MARPSWNSKMYILQTPLLAGQKGRRDLSQNVI